MIIQCPSCEKKFSVPDSAITADGRLVQCSSCGNKWTQYPEKKENAIKSKISISKKITEKKIGALPKKKKSPKKKIGPTIYSKEYLEKKHGLKIGIEASSTNNKRGLKTSNNKSSYFGFYSYLLISLITIFMIFGILNLTKEILIYNFPFLNPYIEILYENINNFKILLRDVFNFY